MSDPLVTVDADAELEKILQKLKSLPDQIAAPNILQKALASTATKTRNRLIKEAGNRYDLSKPEVLREESKVVRNSSDTSATIMSVGGMRDIMDFMTQPNTDTAAAAARVLSSSSMTEIESNGIKAFVTHFSSGHMAIVQRRSEEKYTSAGAAERAKKYGEKADMTKIKKLLSPAVPFMLGSPDAVSTAQKLTLELLNDEIEKQIKKALDE
ncbi:MAG: hypothetical protein ACI4JC_01095 [Faecalibacterium sp.]